jgi:predicted ATPase
MSEVKVSLKKVHIKNYLSLHDVELPLKPLTVLVGPNASGKSNILSALDLLKSMIIDKKPPQVKVIRDRLWAGKASQINFQLQAEVEETRIVYELALKAEAENPFVAEKLSVGNVPVISIQNGEGVVRDENDKNRTKYRSNKLALGSAGDYGNKPSTSALTEFIKGWVFYDFQPSTMRFSFHDLGEMILDEFPELRESPPLWGEGFTLPLLLSSWYEKAPERFHNVSESLAVCTNIRIGQRTIGGELELCLLEGHENPIPLERASDGILRLVAYYILLNQPELPLLIGIEEPERNLHPGALTDITNVLEQIAKRTQVIITTHSSQLLDAFNPENLSDSLGILLLHKRPGHGTEVLNLEDIRKDRAALDGWITDFGIGSAIFDSELLQDLVEE